MMRGHGPVLVVALLAALAGAAASLYFEPRIAQRLARVEPAQRVLGAILDAQAPVPPAGLAVATVGGNVPPMTLHDASGAPMPLPAAWAGRTTLVNLWATWCAPCLKEMPELQAYASAQGSSGTRVVGIALDDALAVRAFLQQHGIAYPNLVDAPGPADAGVRLGNPAGVLPYTVLVSADGRLLKRKIGPFQDLDEIDQWARP